jgi:eukaryotic-like serine/threonine-protein kinase
MISLEPIGRKLIDLQVVSEAQWQLAAAGNPALGTVLERLGRMPGSWFDPDNPEALALTDYQRQVVLFSARKKQLERLGRRLRAGRYLLLGQLGRGGMGVVLLGWDLNKERYVAIKRIHGGAAEKRARFKREARISSRLNHHAICRALGFRRAGKSALLIMEFIPGRNLKWEVGTRQDAIPWHEAARWAVDVLDGLAYAHAWGVVHRDIKPENIMLTPGGREMRAKILDMGLAKWKGNLEEQVAKGDDLTVAGQLIGTPAYMAPEQWKGSENVVPESDIYALGGTLFYILAGRTPFRADSPMGYCVAHTQQKPPRLIDERPDIPPRLDELIGQMLAKLPRQRGTALELLWQFRQLLQTADTAEHEVEPVVAEQEENGRKLPPHAKTLEIPGMVMRGGSSSFSQPTFTPSPLAPTSEIVFSEAIEGQEPVHYRFTRPTRLSFQGHTIARLLPVPGHWALYPVGAEPLVWLNQQPVRDRCRLDIGDVVRLENREWHVEDLIPMESPPGNGSWPGTPSVEIWHEGRMLARVSALPETLIGAGEWCDLRLPAGLGLPANWAVFAFTCRGWEIYSLGSWTFLRDGEPAGAHVTFAGPDEVEQGTLRVVFRPGAVSSDTPSGGRASDTVMLTQTPSPSVGRDSPLYRRCARAMRKAMEGLNDTIPREAAKSLGLGRLLKRWSRPKAPEEELARLEEDLTLRPHDLELLLELGKFFDRNGFDNLYGALLMELYKRHPRNVQLLLDLAEVYARRARQPDRTASSRAQCATEAYTCLVQAQKLRPGDAELDARAKRAAGEMALLKGGFGS